MVCPIEKRQQASFKGVTFYAVSGNQTHGRRGAEGEFPFGENTAYVDLGRKIRVYKLKARFAGPTYIEDKRAFIAACESPGPGQLVHPTMGLLQVACRSAEVDENYEEADGVSYVDLDFVEADLGSFSLTALSGVSIDSGVSNILSALGAAWNLSSIPFFAVQAAAGFASSALRTAQSALAMAISSAPTFAGVTQISDLQLAANDPLCLQSSDNVVSLVGSAFGAIDAQATTPQAAFDAHLSIANWAAQASTTGAEAPVVDALLSALRSLAAAYMARAAQEITSATLDEALTRIGQIRTLLEEEIALAIASCEDLRHLQLRQLESSTLGPLYSQAYLSPPIITYTLKGALPSLVAAHEIYGDATKFQTVETMNPAAPIWSVGPKVYATRQ
jgi:prophage DNA circulation protein